MPVRNRLKEIRMREYMLNQKDFAEKLGVERSTYNTLELNKVQGNAETLLKIAKALNLRVEDIWHLED